MEKRNKISLSRLTGKEIHEKVRKGKMTLQELAAEYACSPDEFLKVARQKVAKKDWPHVLSASKRNAKTKTKTDSANKKAKDVKEKKKSQGYKLNSFQPSQQAKLQAVQQVMPKSPIIKQYFPERPLEEIRKDLVWVDELLDSAQMVHEDCLNRWKRFCQKTDAALKAYKSSTKRTSWAKKQAQSAKANCGKDQEILRHFESLVRNNQREQDLNFKLYTELLGLRQMSERDVSKANATVQKYQLKKKQLLQELSEAD